MIQPRQESRANGQGSGWFHLRSCRGLLAICVCAALMLASAAHGTSAGAGRGAESVKDFVKRLESSYHQVNSIRAGFTQTYVADGRTRVESGTVSFAKGGRMRWDYRQPEEKLFVSDGKFLSLYVPSERQMTRSKVKESDDVRVPFRLLLSRLNLGRVFGHIEFDDQALKPAPGDRVLRAVPKREEEGGYHDVLMEITPDFDIHRLIIQFSDQSTMDFTFDDIQRNAPMSPSIFTFSPPAGTEVIDQPEGN